MRIRYIIIFSFLFLLPAAAVHSREVSFLQIIQFSADEWSYYQNDRQAYRLCLPPQLQMSFKRQNDPEWAIQNRMPFDYVNFRPKGSGSGEYEPFELGVGVHSNRYNLGTREFADKKDEGIIMSGGRIEVIRKADVSVAGIKGVRDDFRLRQPDGWKSYCRIIIPYKDRFFVFLCTLGNDSPVAEYERIFEKIVDSFEIAE